MIGCSFLGTPFFLGGKEIIVGREGKPLYSIQAPGHWGRVDSKVSLQDTTIALTTFQNGPITITIYNFPNLKISPEMQIARWENQLHPAHSQLTPQAFGGFVGKLYEADGILAWAMGLAPELSFRCEGEKTADITIKATGPKKTLEDTREEIIAFARSFQMIEAISLDD